MSAELPIQQDALDAILVRIGQKFTTTFDVMDLDGIPLYTLSITNMPEHIDLLLAHKQIQNPLKDLPLWAKVWPASFVLGRFLRKMAPQGKTMLEIGAGCGITSCIASRYGFSSICVSDVVDDALLFAKANILRNGLHNICSTRRIDILGARLAQKFDIIAASEMLYLPDLHRPIRKFLQRHLADGGKALFCTDMARRQPHFVKQAAKEFAIQEQMIGVKSCDANGNEERRVYIVHTLERA